MKKSFGLAIALTLASSAAQASTFFADGVYRCSLEADDSTFRKMGLGSEFIVATWLGSMSVVWPFGAVDDAGDCEEVGTQRTCKNATENVVLAYDSGSKKFHLIRKGVDLQGNEVERRTISGSCQPMQLKGSTD